MTELKMGMNFTQREAAVWIDIERQQQYIIQVDALLRSCVAAK